MAANPACKTFHPQLSPYIDGELPPAERSHVERHLSACKSCTALVADLRAESGLIRHGLDLAADEADFSDFAQKVLARVTPEKPPLFERWKLSLTEMFTYQRSTFLTVAATAAVVMLVVVPLSLRTVGAPDGYAQEMMTVESVSTAQDARVAPVVLEPEGGATIIWVVDRPPEKKSGDERDDDEESEEELGIQPPTPLPNQERPRSGDL